MPPQMGRKPSRRKGQRNYICKTDRTKKKAEDMKWWTSYGRVAVCHPCGIIIGLRTIFWNESATQVFAFRRDIMEQNPLITRIGYDDACHLAPYIRGNYQDSPDDTARRIADPAKTDFFVDYMHFRGHVGWDCHEKFNPADRDYLKGINTMMVESNWNWMNRYAKIVRTCLNSGKYQTS